MNYTKPNDKEYEDKPEDWLLTSLVFTRAISFLLPENCGIVVDLKGDAVNLYPDAKRVIVGHGDGRVYFECADERTDLNEGDWVEIIKAENIQN